MNENKRNQAGKPAGKNSNKGSRAGRNKFDGRREGNKDDRKGSAPVRAGDTLHNDPSWYEPFSGSTDLVARVSFGNPLGQPIELGSIPYTNVESSTRMAIPGILKYTYRSIPGIAKVGDINAPINMAAKAFYTTVRYAQRGSGTYDDSELMMYALAVSSAYEFWAWCRRVYGTMNMYSVGNKYLSKAVIESMDVDFNDLHEHIYDFQGYINQLAYQLGALCMPADFHFVDRRVRLNSNLYVDSESVKAQMYYFTPQWFWQYDEFTDESHSSLKPVHLPGSATFADIVNTGNSILNAIITSESFMNMGGDIKNAYGEGALKKVSLTPEDYTAPILHDAEMCMEIQNLTVFEMEEDFTSDQWIISDRETNTIAYNPALAIEQSQPDFKFTDAVLLNMRKDEPAAKDVMRATRLTALLRRDGDRIYYATAGTEIVQSAQSYVFSYANDGRLIIQPEYALNTWVNGDAPTKDMVHALTVAEKYDWHNYQYFFNGSGNIYAISGDVDNVTSIDSNLLQKLNVYAILGLFKTPQMGTFITR